MFLKTLYSVCFMTWLQWIFSKRTYCQSIQKQVSIYSVKQDLLMNYFATDKAEPTFSYKYLIGFKFKKKNLEEYIPKEAT